MKLVVGLGNPGRKYAQTRHNIGFMVAARLAHKLAATSPRIKFEGEVADASLGGDKVLILCPQTFMNASGQSVRKAVDFFKLPLSDLLVICDDLNLESGRLRIRPSGSAGGQNGVKDIIRHLGTDSFARLRIGIGRPPDGWSTTDYVLGAFSVEEQQSFEAVVERAAEAAICFASEGVGPAMSRFNAADQPAASSRQRQSEGGGAGKTTRSSQSIDPTGEPD